MKFHSKLTPLQRTALKNALDTVARGIQPVVAIRYEGGGTRKAGVDYIPLPGVPGDFHIGPIETADAEKIRIRDAGRSDGADPGISYLTIAKIFEFALLFKLDKSEKDEHRPVRVPTKEKGRRGIVRRMPSVDPSTVPSS